MKHGKQLISMLLAMVMVLSLAACGTGDTSKTPNTSTPNTSTPAAPAEPITITLGVPASANVTEWDNNKLVLWLEEETGYNIEIVSFAPAQADYLQQLGVMVAGKEKLPDILLYFSGMPSEYKTDGYFVDLMQFFNDPNNADAQEYLTMMQSNMEEGTWKRLWGGLFDAEGHLYAFPHFAATDRPYDYMYINQTWLDNLGLEMPTNWDELIAVLTAFVTQDPNGNGKNDELALVGGYDITRSDIPMWIINQKIFYRNHWAPQIGEDGKLFLTYTADGFREGLKLGRQLYDLGLLTDLTWTIKSNSELASIQTPADGVAKCGIISGIFGSTSTVGSEIVYEYVPLPWMEGAKTLMIYTQAMGYNHITEDCENPEAAFKVLTTLASPEGSRRQSFGEYGVDWEWGTDYKTGIKGVIDLDPSVNALVDQTDSTFGYQFITSDWDFDPENADDVANIQPPPCFVADPNPPSTEVTWESYTDQLYEDMLDLAYENAAKNNPELVVTREMLIYTTEETEVRDVVGLRSALFAFVKGEIGQFMTGVKDIYDDKVWAEYCDTINNEMGGTEFLEIAQAAFDRFQANIG